MSAADASRLEHIQDTLSQTLEAQITELMAHIHAAEELTQTLSHTESEIAKYTQLRDRLRARMGSSQSDAVKADAQKKIKRLQRSLSEMTARRTELLGNLDALTASIRAQGGSVN